ncbi:MBL fold metallo-hydrolase RNA specificity domain-containing protein, partial [Vibrio metschnikovii]|uniref:MBL fold metallo-hydrolase RNA specificity domain-containing protein n=1 Tax=Vibrio metschnikovii TaxID=28172 RepID=UPI0023E00E8E
DRQIAVIDQNCRSRSRWCRGFYEKLIARSRYLNSGISCGMTDGEEIDVKASIHVMSGYSAHADQSELLAFIKGIDQPPKEIHLIHGERSAKQGFAKALTEIGYSGLVIS